MGILNYFMLEDIPYINVEVLDGKKTIYMAAFHIYTYL